RFFQHLIEAGGRQVGVGKALERSGANMELFWLAGEYSEEGCSFGAVRRHRFGRPASRVVIAISFVVFCGVDLSASLIMRSRNVSPGFEVMRTLIPSESTRVPPVTAERSPPDSRITGADSPVIADSSTDATPSMTSPSPGIKSPATTLTISPERSFE